MPSDRLPCLSARDATASKNSIYVISGRAFSMIAIMVGVLVLILLLLVAIFLTKFKTQKKEDLNVRHIGGSIYNKVPGIDTGPEGDEMED